MNAEAHTHSETYEEGFAKLPKTDQNRHVLIEMGFSSVLYDERTSGIIGAEDTGKVSILLVEDDFDPGLPWLTVDFGGPRNYRVRCAERPLGPAHVSNGFNVVDVYEI